MKKQIRNKVFESNSSSSHSLTVNRLGLTAVMDVDAYRRRVVTGFGEFGWGYDEYSDPETKLSYLVTMLVETHNECSTMEELCETEDFKMINDAVAGYLSKYCVCEGIYIDEEVCASKYGWLEHEGYIDHQSVLNIQDLLEAYECTIEEFIFDPGIVLVIDNDNH